jgi:Homeodomain-like domain-containing protein
MRTGVEVRLGLGDRERLEAVVASRNSPQKHVWRSRIVLLSADGIGTMEIQRRIGKSKPTIWRWQQRFMEAGVDGLLRDATRPGRKVGSGRWLPSPMQTTARTLAIAETETTVRVTPLAQRTPITSRATEIKNNGAPA